MSKDDLSLLTEEYLKLKPQLSEEAQAFYEKVSQMLWEERLEKNKYKRLLKKTIRFLYSK